MSRPQYILCPKTAKLAVGDRQDVYIDLWDNDWKEYGIFPHPGAKLTTANLRGMVRRNMRLHGYKAEILEDEVPNHADNRDTGVTFRFYKLTRDELPPDQRDPLQLDLFTG